MLHFDNIVGALNDLSHEEKIKLRLLLDADLKLPVVAASEPINPAKRIIGLFADEPELMDRVMEAVDERRSSPLRLNP